MCQCGSNPYVNHCSNCPPGLKGDDGTSFAFRITDEAPGVNCLYGGYLLEGGPNVSGDGTLDSVTISKYICNAAPGADGATPTFTAGTVTALAFGATPTIDLVATGLNQYRIDLGIPAGPQGVPGPEQMFWGRTAFVDSVTGNDGTGVVGDATKPYLTVQAAITGITFEASGMRGAVYIRNGSYTSANTITVDDWIDIYGDSFTLICTTLLQPVITFAARSHIFAPGASIAHAVTGGKALYAASFYSGTITLNKIVGAVDINGNSSFTIKVRDVLPTASVNSPSGFGDLASGNWQIKNSTAYIEIENCWSTIRVSDSGAVTSVVLKGNFKNGLWMENDVTVELKGADVSRNNTLTRNVVVFIDNNAKLKTFASRIKGVSAALIPLDVSTANAKAFLNSTVLVASGGAVAAAGIGDIYNVGGVSANAVVTPALQVYFGTQPIFEDAAVE